MDAGLHIALVTPFSWSVPTAVNCHVAGLASELRRMGHYPVVVASSDDDGDAARVKALFHRARGQVLTLLEDYRSGGPAADLLLPCSDANGLGPEAGVPVVPVGFSFPVRLNGSVASLGLPVDVTSRLEKLMIGGLFDLVHVHEPLAPSLSFTALREARSPVVGSFHLTPVGAAAYELGQAVLERFFLRLDARVVVHEHGRRMMEDLFPGAYEVLSCGTTLSAPADGPPRPVGRAVEGGGRVALHVYRGDARRSYRALVRALLTEWPSGLDRLIVALHGPSAERWLPRAVPRRLRTRISLHEFRTDEELAGLYRKADVSVLPYLGGEWLCTSLAEAAVVGCPVIAPDLPPAQEHLSAGAAGSLYSPGDSASLSDAIAKTLLRLDTGAETSVAPPRSDVSTMTHVASRLVHIYHATIAPTDWRQGTRTPVAGRSMHVRGIGQESIRRRARALVPGPARSDWIYADLHMHSDYSKDCVSTVESIIATAREIGLGAIAIADHNQIEGAFRARELAEGNPFVIVAEEVKTSEGEVIGLFLKEWIPKGLSFDKTLSLIKEQGGLVYVPHPFDALRTTPSYRTLVDNLHRIDVMEIYNAKVALSSFNLSAERFAAKYNIVAGAGSDAHVLQALGTAMLRMPRFTDAQSFLAALWEADIITRRKSLLYLQSLKWLHTTLDRVLPEA